MMGTSDHIPCGSTGQLALARGSLSITWGIAQSSALGKGRKMELSQVPVQPLRPTTQKGSGDAGPWDALPMAAWLVQGQPGVWGCEALGKSSHWSQ